MPYTTRGTTPFTKLRILISGLSKSGKTTSLPSFIYGHYDYWSPDTQADALEYAAQKTMVIVSCPGETGHTSLPPDSPQLTSYYDEIVAESSMISAAYSEQAIQDFLTITDTVRKNKPDVLAWDGLHYLYNHILNLASNGEFLSGLDMDKDPAGRTVQYRASKFYNRARHNMTEWVSAISASSIPVFVATCAEKWEEVAKESDRTNVNNKRYLWPDFSGEMATRMVGLFDARVSARLEQRCLHPHCAFSQHLTEHHVWQFLSRGDVMGVGIRGMVSDHVRHQCPFIHQSAPYLYRLMRPPHS